MKKTLFASFFYPPETGGIQTYLKNLVKQLPPEKVVVLARSAKNDVTFDQKQPYKIYRTAFNSKLKYIKLSNISFYKTLKNIIQKEKIEQIILGHPLPLGISCQYLNIPYSTFVHGKEITEVLEKNSLQKKALIKTLKNAQNIFCTSEFMKDLLQEKTKIPAEKIKIIPPGVQIHKIPDPSSVVRDEKSNTTLLTVARMVKRKGHHFVLHALKEVLKNHPETKLIFTSSGPEEKNLKELAKKLNIQQNVEFRGKISNKQLQETYQESDIFIMPTFNDKQDIEGFGIVYLEAAAAKCTTIATDIGGVPEAVIHNETGIVLDPAKNEHDNLFIQKLADTIITLIKDQNLQKKLGENAHTRVKQKFSWQTQAEKLKQFL